jgi:preprotein translocase subunit YajC
MSFIPAAYAAEAAANIPASAGYTEMAMLAVFALVAYFLLIRPQSKRMKEQRQLVASLAKGDEVVTAGGMVGKITRLEDNFIILAIADNVEVKFQRQAVTQVLPKGTIKAI